MHEPQHVSDSALIATVARLAAVADSNRRLPAEVLDAIREQGLFRLLVPAELGGGEVALPEALCTFEQAARVDGNFGWAVTIGAGGGVFAAFMPPATATAWYTDPRAVVAGSGVPAGVARSVPGGHRLSGRWRYCSGAPYATLFTFNARIDDGDAVRAFILPPGAVDVIEDWDAVGLTATASHTVAVDDVFVPDTQTFTLASRPWPDAPLYRFAFRQFAETSFAAVMLGLAAAFVDAADALIGERAAQWSADGQRLDTVRTRTREARARLTIAHDGFHAAVGACWSRHRRDGDTPPADLERLSLVCLQAARQSLEVAQALYPYLGMAATRRSSTLNRAWRDLHTASQHVMISPLQYAG